VWHTQINEFHGAPTPFFFTSPLNSTVLPTLRVSGEGVLKEFGFQAHRFWGDVAAVVACSERLKPFVPPCVPSSLRIAASRASQQLWVAEHPVEGHLYFWHTAACLQNVASDGLQAVAACHIAGFVFAGITYLLLLASSGVIRERLAPLFRWRRPAGCSLSKSAAELHLRSHARRTP
jgi:hypothetical protein